VGCYLEAQERQFAPKYMEYPVVERRVSGHLISLELFDSRPLNLHLFDLVSVVYITFCCSFVLCLIFMSKLKSSSKHLN
jgi:hypothetical protein